MRTLLTRAAALAAVLVVALPVAASAEVDEYAAEASTSAVSLSVFENVVGSPVLVLLSTDANASSDPTASAEIQPITVLGEDLMAVREATSEGDLVRDPAAESDDCVAPVNAQGLSVNVICTSALADAGGPGEARANATADLAQVEVNGTFIETLLTDSLTTTLQDLTDDLADGITADAIGQLRDGCDALLGDAPELPLVGDLVAMGPQEFQDLPGVQDLIDAGDNPCAAIDQLKVVELVDETIGVDLAPVAEALANSNILSIDLDGAESDVTGGEEALVATADQALVTITGPALLDVLDDAITAAVTALENALIENLPTEVTDQLPEDATVSGPVAEILAMVPLFGIEEPLLTAEVNGGTATASLLRDDVSATAGGQQPYVEVAVAPEIVTLLMGDEEMATQRLEAGQSQDLGPLGSLEVGVLTTEDGVTFGDTDLTGSTAAASATTVRLLTDVEGGIELVLAESSAGAYGSAPSPPAPAPDPDPEPQEPLPHTGGGAAAVAALALGAAFVLRRRRD